MCCVLQNCGDPVEFDFNKYFTYDINSPTKLTWSVDIRTGKDGRILSVKSGDAAGTFETHKKTGKPKATHVTLNKKTYKVHRVIWMMFNGPIPSGMVIDHLDGNPWNNKIENLECKTPKHNWQNKKAPTNNTSGKVGVVWHNAGKGKYRYAMASVKKCGKMVRKSFPAHTLGDEVAFKLACEWRDLEILKMNEAGENYIFRQ